MTTERDTLAAILSTVMPNVATYSRPLDWRNAAAGLLAAGVRVARPVPAGDEPDLTPLAESMARTMTGGDFVLDCHGREHQRRGLCTHPDHDGSVPAGDEEWPTPGIALAEAMQAVHGDPSDFSWNGPGTQVQLRARGFEIVPIARPVPAGDEREALIARTYIRVRGAHSPTADEQENDEEVRPCAWCRLAAEQHIEVERLLAAGVHLTGDAEEKHGDL